MNDQRKTTDGLLLVGMDGSNPLAFLAALGTLRTLTLAWADRNVKMSWTQHSGAWRPVLYAAADLDINALVHAIVAALHVGTDVASWHPHLKLGKNLSVAPAKFAEHARHSTNTASLSDRRWADFVASFGSEILTHPKLDRIDYTEFCFLFGSGHQHYLDTMKKLLENITARHFQEALFDAWKYEDLRLSMRWDPADRREHAYQWTAPGDETVLSVWGANLLAAEGSALYPTVPTSAYCPTTGFRRSRRHAVFTWPIWKPPIGSDTVRSLLAGELIQEDEPDPVARRELGLVAVFRAQKVKIGEGANFKWSFSQAEAV